MGHNSKRKKDRNWHKFYFYFREKAQREEQERLTAGDRQKSGRAITASFRIMPFVGRSAKTAVRQQQQQQQHADNNQKSDAQKILNSSKADVENHESSMK
jgi:hypothetical protein